MNTKRMIRWIIVLFLLAALPVMTAVMAQDDYELEINDQVWGTNWYDLDIDDCHESTWHFTMPNSGSVLIDNWAHGVSEDFAQVCLEGGSVSICAPVGKKALIFHSLKAGDYDIHVGGGYLSEEDGICYNYSLSLTSPLLVSAAAANLGTGTVGGIPFKSEDILAWSHLNNGTERWVMLFDGSDVGVKTVTNIASNGGDELLISLGGTQILPGVGTVTPWDIIVFDPDEYGTNTRGKFRWGLDGSANQLTTSGEKLDAIDGWVNGYDRCYGFPLSTAGVATVTGWLGTMKQDDEDVFCKVYNGSWQPYDWFFDVRGGKNAPPSEPAPGIVTGLAGEDVFAMAYNDATDSMNLTILGSGTIAGHKVTQKDIFAINYPAYTWGGLVWHGQDHGWNYNIDAFEFSGN